MAAFMVAERLPIGMLDVPEWNRRRYSLAVPAGLILLLSLLYIPLSYGSLLADVPEVIVPLGISSALVAFSFRLRRLDCDVDEIRRVATWSWLGLFAAALVGGWWALVSLTRGSTVVGLSDQILALLSFGIGAGVVAGHNGGSREDAEWHGQAGRVVAETTWVGRNERDTITAAVAESLGEAEGVEPTELEFTLYDHVDPDVFEMLSARGDSPWQLLFHVEAYEVRVASYGTVTVLEPDRSEQRGEATEPSP